jgi:hypothetical protein
MIKQPKIDGRWKHLRNDFKVQTTTFAKMISEDLSDWLKRCPKPDCNHKLAVVEHEDFLYGLWCEECGWTAEEGWDFSRNYLPMPEAAREAGADYNTLLTLALNGRLGAQNFGNGQKKAQWYLPMHTVQRLKREGLDLWLKRTELAPATVQI